MFCIHCGNSLPDNAAFCNVCGKPTVEPANAQNVPVNPQPAPVYQQSAPVYPQPAPTYVHPGYPQYQAAIAPTKTNKRPTLQLILGAVLLLCGILPYTLLTDASSYIAAMRQQAYSYGFAVVASINALNAIFGSLEPVLRFPASIVALVTGHALLSNRRGGKTLAIVSGIFNTLSALFFGLLYLLMMQPLVLISLFHFGGTTSEALSTLNQLGLLDNIGSALLCSAVLAIITAGVSFGSLYFARGQETQTLQKRDRSLTALPIMLPLLSLCRICIGVLPVILTGLRNGSSALSALGIANSMLGNHTAATYAALFLLLLAMFCVFKPFPFGWSALITGGGVLLCATGLYFASPSPQAFGAPAEITEAAMEMYRFTFWGSTLMLIAVCIWIVAVTRNAVPLWLQWVLSCAIIPVYVVVEVSGLTIAQLSSPGIGQFVCAIVILGATVTAGLLRTGRNRA